MYSAAGDEVDEETDADQWRTCCNFVATLITIAGPTQIAHEGQGIGAAQE